MKYRQLAVPGVIVCVLFITVVTNSRAPVRAAPPYPPTSAPAQEIQIKMADGLAVKGTFYPTSAGTPGPAVLLLHQYNGNRRQWDAFTAALTAKGYNVLAVDQRGFGET